MTNVPAPVKAPKYHRKKARKARAAAARPGTVAADHRIIIKDKPHPAVAPKERPTHLQQTPLISPADLFTAEELATMPLIIRKTATGLRTMVWRSHDGSWWRDTGYIRIKNTSGRRVYEISLLKGANVDDLRVLQAEVARLRNGESKRHWAQIIAPWADEKTLTFRFRHRAYQDPYMHHDLSPNAVVCEEPKCREQWHEDNDRHVLDDIVKRFPDGGWEIEVRKDQEDDDRGWYLEVFTDEFFGTPEDVASFMNDLQWMSEECRRANRPLEELEEAVAA